MKVVFVNRFFFPDTSATSQILSDLAFHLAADCEVHVVTSRLRYDVPDDPLPARENVRGVAVVRVWTSRFGRSSLVGRTIDYATFYVSALWRVLRLASRGDIVVALTDPPLISVPIAWAARAKRAVLINWLHDIFPEIATELDFSRWPAWVGRALAWMRDRSLDTARCNVVLGERMREFLTARGIDGSRLSVIQNWASGTDIRPLSPQDNPLRREWGIGSEFVVGYSGNMGRAHELTTVLEAARLLSDTRDIRFVLVGGGKQRTALEAIASENGLANITFQPYQPRERLRETLTLPDCHIVSLKPALEGLVVPSKVYGCLAAGRPVIFLGSDDGEIGRLIAASPGFGICVHPEDSSGLVSVIQRLRSDAALTASMGQTARRLFESRYDQPAAFARWRAVLARAGTWVPGAGPADSRVEL
ncbi:MAG TPA: glycosyltransferase family 4 protein [Vicinamibacterales bacterium]|nr:glycosyltransferase family 4 protein [Vicinamibacterales bacterium]